MKNYILECCVDTLEAAQAAMNGGAILTSGGKATAWEGMAMLELLCRNSGAVRIMAGAGVEAGVIAELHRATGISAYHLSGRVIAESPMRFRKEAVPIGLPGLSEYARWECSAEKIALARAVLEEIGQAAHR